ncbi:methyltransferase [Nocardia sp. CS682]|uniref:methyltransferase n=1 Tax=Nocardia sp. CS682 TaxID=1047172 RepID=UPI00197D4BDB|nr:methyltransferase [Nocardia sp. CS682]
MTSVQRGEVALTPTGLMEIATNFWRAKTLAAAVELGIFTLLARTGPLSSAEIAHEAGIKMRPADMFLASCAALGLLVEKDGEYGNSATAAQFLVEGRPDYFGGFVRFCDAREYPAWGRLVEALRTDRPMTWDPATQDSPFAREDRVMTEMFWEALHVAATYTARGLADTYDFGAHHRLLDVGGGSGAFLIELCRGNPALRGTLYELDHVCADAAARIVDAGLANQIDTVAGDFIADPALPEGFDVILISGVLHNWDPATNCALIRKSYNALRAGGALLVCELMLDSRRAGPADAALMGLNMVIETTAGKNYSETEYREWVAACGFEGIEIRRLDGPGANAVLVARRL